jgi:hypothetical protein
LGVVSVSMNMMWHVGTVRGWSRGSGRFRSAPPVFRQRYSLALHIRQPYSFAP